MTFPKGQWTTERHRRPCSTEWPDLFPGQLVDHRCACIYEEETFTGTGLVEHRCKCGATYTVKPLPERTDT